jgi:hypothetical protein
MISLGSGLAALALLRARQLFDFAVELLDLPAHVVRFLSDLQGQVVIRLISKS